MFVKSIELKNYRNHKHLKLQGIDKINLITGPNAVGKSNLMEALMRFNGYGRQRDHLIMFGEKEAVVHVEVQRKSSTASYRLIAEKVNEKSKIQKNQPLGPMPIIYFSPADNSLFGGSPQDRRLFMDQTCVLLKKKYQKDLQEYQQIIKQKNSFLKNGFTNQNLLNIFNLQIVNKAEVIIRDRINLLIKTKPLINEVLRKIIATPVNTEFVYVSKTNLENIKESLHEQLKEREDLERIRGCCLVGPHRDDFLLELDGISIADFGSQGEKKTACLSLKMAQLQIMQQNNLNPVLILDDALSELDENRRQLLIETINQCNQTFITATDELGLVISEDIKRFELS